jgi:hypothetical protein
MARGSLYLLARGCTYYHVSRRSTKGRGASGRAKEAAGAGAVLEGVETGRGASSRAKEAAGAGAVLEGVETGRGASSRAKEAAGAGAVLEALAAPCGGAR